MNVVRVRHENLLDVVKRVVMGVTLGFDKNIRHGILGMKIIGSLTRRDIPDDPLPRMFHIFSEF